MQHIRKMFAPCRRYSARCGTRSLTSGSQLFNLHSLFIMLNQGDLHQTSAAENLALEVLLALVQLAALSGTLQLAPSSVTSPPHILSFSLIKQPLVSLKMSLSSATNGLPNEIRSFMYSTIWTLHGFQLKLLQLSPPSL